MLCAACWYRINIKWWWCDIIVNSVTSLSNDCWIRLVIIWVWKTRFDLNVLWCCTAKWALGMTSRVIESHQPCQPSVLREQWKWKINKQFNYLEMFSETMFMNGNVFTLNAHFVPLTCRPDVKCMCVYFISTVSLFSGLSWCFESCKWSWVFIYTLLMLRFMSCVDVPCEKPFLNLRSHIFELDGDYFPSQRLLDNDRQRLLWVSAPVAYWAGSH